MIWLVVMFVSGQIFQSDVRYFRFCCFVFWLVFWCILVDVVG